MMMNFLKQASAFSVFSSASSRRNALAGIRHFTSTTPVQERRPPYDKFRKITKYVKRIDENEYTIGQEHPKNLRIPKKIPETPHYKYETRFFKRQNRGLYGGRQRTASKTCSEYFNKNLRSHRPNVNKGGLWSEILNKRIQARISANVLKTVSKVGGIDQYLLKSTPARIKTMGLLGWKLRYQLLQKLEQDERGTLDSKPVQYIHPDGRKFTQTKKQILDELFEHVKRDSYLPVHEKQFLKEYCWLSYGDLVAKLDEYNAKFGALIQSVNSASSPIQQQQGV
ncbi:mitochondrial 54S ribosomal protein bL28m [Lodderomyces beijingensis]|uniref:54S ribosomal protein L24, mitochondrial n=1 Tax=Lodderomyces beijingensis TaxID=1775926 RepID=A0ABP0ZQF1_9ASCO